MSVSRDCEVTHQSTGLNHTKTLASFYYNQIKSINEVYSGFMLFADGYRISIQFVVKN